MFKLALTLVSLAGCQAGCQGGHRYSSRTRVASGPPGNLAEELTKIGATTLVDLVVKAGLADTVSNGGPFTVFAPTNQAFAKVPKEILDALGADNELLKKVLLFHVLEGEVASSAISNDLTVNSVQGGQHRYNIYRGYFGNTVTVNGKRIIKTDLKASNGVIHLVEDVLYPIPEGNIAEVVVGDARFSTLLAAVQAAGLVDTLAGEGPFTVFAPTNDAFAKIPADTLNGLLADKDALTKVLLRHVVPGTVYAKGIKRNTLATAGGENISALAKPSGVKVSSGSASAKVVQADVLATNGVIHAIDTVI